MWSLTGILQGGASDPNPVPQALEQPELGVVRRGDQERRRPRCRQVLQEYARFTHQTTQDRLQHQSIKVMLVVCTFEKRSHTKLAS